MNTHMRLYVINGELQEAQGTRNNLFFCFFFFNSRKKIHKFVLVVLSIAFLSDRTSATQASTSTSFILENSVPKYRKKIKIEINKKQRLPRLRSFLGNKRRALVFHVVLLLFLVSKTP
jgi:hypothetical protein